MDAFLAVASKREVRECSDCPVPDVAARRILEAGRVAGSSRHGQPWRFIVVADPGVRERLAEALFAAGNVRGAGLVVAIACGAADRRLLTLVALRRE